MDSELGKKKLLRREIGTDREIEGGGKIWGSRGGGGEGGGICKINVKECREDGRERVEGWGKSLLVGV